MVVLQWKTSVIFHIKLTVIYLFSLWHSAIFWYFSKSSKVRDIFKASVVSILTPFSFLLDFWVIYFLNFIILLLYMYVNLAIVFKDYLNIKSQGLQDKAFWFFLYFFHICKIRQPAFFPAFWICSTWWQQMFILWHKLFMVLCQTLK